MVVCTSVVSLGVLLFVTWLSTCSLPLLVVDSLSAAPVLLLSVCVSELVELVTLASVDVTSVLVISCEAEVSAFSSTWLLLDTFSAVELSALEVSSPPVSCCLLWTCDVLLVMTSELLDWDTNVADVELAISTWSALIFVPRTPALLVIIVKPAINVNCCSFFFLAFLMTSFFLFVFNL